MSTFQRFFHMQNSVEIEVNVNGEKMFSFGDFLIFFIRFQLVDECLRLLYKNFTCSELNDKIDFVRNFHVKCLSGTLWDIRNFHESIYETNMGNMKLKSDERYEFIGFSSVSHHRSRCPIKFWLVKHFFCATWVLFVHFVLISVADLVSNFRRQLNSNLCEEKKNENSLSSIKILTLFVDFEPLSWRRCDFCAVGWTLTVSLFSIIAIC